MSFWRNAIGERRSGTAVAGKTDGSAMNNFPVALLSAAEFEIARDLVSGLSVCSSYEDWLDRRYGMVMGRSLGGDDTGFVTVNLEPFLEWCAHRGVRPSEVALDAFAVQSAPRQAHSAA